MEATFATAGAFRSVVDALRGLLTHATFNCDADGVQLHTMDAEHVALVDLHLRRAGFARYSCKRTFSFSVPVRGLLKIVRAADANAQLTMRAEPRDDHVQFSFQTAQRAVSLALARISLDTERLGTPENEYNCVLTLPSAELARVCGDLAQLGATAVELSCGAAGLHFAADTAGVRAGVLLRAPPQRPQTQAFSCRYLTKLVRARALNDLVDVCMDPHLPLRLRFRVGQLGALDLYLAPLVNSDAKDAP